MKISALQMDAILGDREANQHTAVSLMQEAMNDSPDVLVLPELWDVGFYPPKALEYGDEEGQSAKSLLSAFASGYRVNVVGGSIARRTGDTVRNTCYVFNRAGKLVAEYDKIHSFSPSAEDKLFQAGNKSCVFLLDDVPCGVIICYDLRFGELSRMLALAGAQIIFAPAAWPHPRLNHWRLLSQARAIENQCFFAAVNNCGKAGKVTFCGSSMIVDPWGEILAKAGQDQICIAADCDLGVLKDIRQKINVFRDRRPALYRIGVGGE